jgi:hypothetical protein
VDDTDDFFLPMGDRMSSGAAYCFTWNELHGEWNLLGGEFLGENIDAFAVETQEHIMPHFDNYLKEILEE